MSDTNHMKEWGERGLLAGFSLIMVSLICMCSIGWENISVIRICWTNISPTLPSMLCIKLEWTFNILMWYLPVRLHTYCGFSPVWVLMCHFSRLSLLKAFSWWTELVENNFLREVQEMSPCSGQESSWTSCKECVCPCCELGQCGPPVLVSFQDWV